jgi:hypothetical protein
VTKVATGFAKVAAKVAVKVARASAVIAAVVLLLSPAPSAARKVVGSSAGSAAVALLPSPAASAAAPVIISGVSDANQPPSNNLGIPCAENFCVPTAAANVVEYWDATVGHRNAADVAGSLSLNDIAEHLSWFMATNGRLDGTCTMTAMGQWGRTNARATGTSGTNISDLAIGVFEFARWDGDYYPFPGPSQPPPPIGKAGRKWQAETELQSAYSALSDMLQAYQDEVDVDRPTLLSFEHWNLEWKYTDGNGVQYYEWLADVDDTGHVDYMPTYRDDDNNESSTPPSFQEWNGTNLGHTVTGVGYVLNFDHPSGTGLRDWVIVRDNFPSTGTNVAVPFLHDTTSVLSYLNAITFVDTRPDHEPELAESSSGSLHSVWWDGVDEVFHASSVSAGTVSGTMIRTGRQPDVAIDPTSGVIYVAFAKPGPSINDNIYVTSSSDGGSSWSADVQVSDHTNCGSCRNPSIVVDSSSHVHVVWEDDCDSQDFVCGDDWEVYSADKDAAAGWAAPQQVTRDNNATSPCLSPPLDCPHFLDDIEADLESDGSDLFLVYTRDGKDVFLREGAVSGSGDATWGSPLRANFTSGGSVRRRDPDAAADSHGDGHVVWADERNGNWEVYYRAQASGSFTGSDTRVTNGAPASATPDLSAESKTNGADLHVVWAEEAAAGNYEIYYDLVTNNGSGTVNVGGTPSNESSSVPPSLEPAVLWGGTTPAVQTVWAESVHLASGPPAFLGHIFPVIPPLFDVPVVEPERQFLTTDPGVPFDIVGFTQAFGTSPGPAAGVEVQLFQDGLPVGPPLLPSTDFGESGRFSFNHVILDPGLYAVTSTAFDLQTGYLSGESAPPLIVPEPGMLGSVAAGFALLLALGTRGGRIRR